MKQLFAGILCCSLILSLFGCTPSDAVIDSLPAYQDMVMYTEGGFQDSTDYAITIIGIWMYQYWITAHIFRKSPPMMWRIFYHI